VYLTRVHGSKKIHIFLRKWLTIHFVFFGFLWVLNSFNMLNLIRLIVSLPLILILGLDILNRLVAKKSVMEYTEEIPKANLIYDGFLFLGILGLIFYNIMVSDVAGLIMIIMFSISSLACLYVYYTKQITKSEERTP
ncbi:MAG: hypothetical protein ACFFDT_38365, partial [Candidatus Hodarchaeota archaeon]